MNVGVGQADADTASEAGKTAAEQALEQAGEATFALAFGSVAYDQDDLAAAIHDTLDAPVVGCSTGGEVTVDGASTETVVVMAFDADDGQFSVGVGEGIADDERETGRRAARNALNGIDRRPVTVQQLRDWEGERGDLHAPVDFTIFATTLTGNASEMMRGIKDIVGDGFQAAGGLAGDDWQLDQTYVYRDGEALTDAVVVAAMDSPYRRGIGIRHGLERTEHQFEVTRSEENVVHELDGRPTAEVYRDIFGTKGENPQFIMTKPLGIEAGEEEPRLRDPLVINDDGSIVFAAEIQEGSRVTIMDSPPETVIEGARAATRQAYERAGEPDEVAAVVLHDCVCRWNCLKNQETRKKEIEAVQDIVGDDTPLIGWYTYGEIALPRTLAGVHNQTLVAQVYADETAE